MLVNRFLRFLSDPTGRKRAAAAQAAMALADDKRNRRDREKQQLQQEQAQQVCILIEDEIAITRIEEMSAWRECRAAIDARALAVIDGDSAPDDFMQREDVANDRAARLAEHRNRLERSLDRVKAGLKDPFFNALLFQLWTAREKFQAYARRLHSKRLKLERDEKALAEKDCERLMED